jgi:hypothetical protein
MGKKVLKKYRLKKCYPSSPPLGYIPKFNHNQED